MYPQERRPTTIAVRSGIDTDTQHGAVIPPLYLSSNFSFSGFGQKRTYDYTRSGNPTRDTLATALADLEGGYGTVVTATGMATITLICHLMEQGELIVAPHDCYGGTHRLLSYFARMGHFKVEFIDFGDAAKLAHVLAKNPRICWVETPSNPLLSIVDIKAVSGQKSAQTLLVVDNTFLSPLGQQPLALGADVVVHSTTKYINGHSDVVGGAVISKAADVHEKLAWLANCLGITGAPFDSFLTLRGLRTLPIRFKKHEENAAAIAAVLAAHPHVDKVYYPGLTAHPQHHLALRQQSSFGAMISFNFKGDAAALQRFLGSLTLFTLAESLGGVESLIAHPATMTHASMSSEAREVAGISDSLLRLSVGIEDALDLCRDLNDALNCAYDLGPAR